MWPGLHNSNGIVVIALAKWIRNSIKFHQLIYTGIKAAWLKDKTQYVCRPNGQLDSN